MSEKLLDMLEVLERNFAHLHVHYEYSNIRLLDSINKIPNVLKYVSQLGQNAVAITDHDSLSGHVKFLKQINYLKKEGILNKDFKGVLGNEIYLVNENEMWANVQLNEKVNFYHFLLLAKDEIGHGQLKELSTLAWDRCFSYKGMDRVPTYYSDIENIVGNCKGHLVASTACLGSYLATQVKNILFDENVHIDVAKDNIDQFIKWCLSIFGEDFYIEIQTGSSEEQVKVNQYVLKIAEEYGIKHIITTDAHYLKAEDRPVHKAFLTSDSDGESGGREVDDFYETTRFYEVSDIIRSFDYLEDQKIIDGIMNTKEITDRIQEYDLFHNQIVPTIPIPEGEEWFFEQDIYDLILDHEWLVKAMESEERYDRYLLNQALAGMQEKIPTEEYQSTLARMDIEFMEILKSSEAKKEPLSAYFVVEKKNIDIIWEEANSIVGPGRGSAVGYIIDYLIGITQVNPLKQGMEMPHWRFISGERPDMPNV